MAYNLELLKMKLIQSGKMFGVLLVQNSKNEIGYLAAFSGKLSGVNHLFFLYHQFIA